MQIQDKEQIAKGCVPAEKEEKVAIFLFEPYMRSIWIGSQILNPPILKGWKQK